jgi:rubredoxin
MGRKKRCPECGSKKVDFYSIPKKCKTCGFTWTGKEKTRDAKKDKVRF